jgi:hypothetical protein
MRLMPINEPEDKSGDDCPILCPFCSAPWSDSNLRLYDLDAGDHCASGRFSPENCSVLITCHRCDRDMYRKDGVEFA